MEMKSILSVPYDINNYNRFVLEFFNELDKVPYKEIKPNANFANVIEHYSIHGTYKDPEGNDIIVLSVKVINNSNARQAQRNFVSYLLTNDFNQYSAAMVAYYDDVRTNWKLSFVTVEIEIGNSGIELKFKPAKRFSFLVGENEPTKTYIQQLGPIYSSKKNPTLNIINVAFSVSRLSKDFYEDYKKKFFELVDFLSCNEVFINESKKLGYDNPEKFAITFSKKTLGQMVFLHFVQKKGWLGVTSKWGDGDQRYLINSTNSFVGDNYFNDFLEPLFYEALNCKRENYFYLGKKIPFLNGGLFQPIEQYDWRNTNFNIPNEFWFNKNDSGLIDVLSQYNFTIDESNPSEQDVAVDPEMLGKIFESLLDVKDRSDLGAFYTPRDIVHYMCEESIKERLSKLIGIDSETIINYIRYGDALKETDYIESFANEIDEIISKITIVDPAVGSGAFLVGMLNQIVTLRYNLQRSTSKNNASKFDIKMQAIQNSLYGVDVEYDAIEIAKLRLWLSLIVDQDATHEAPKPLPNLSFHLRVGNSLLDTFENIKLWNNKWRGSKIIKTRPDEYQMNLFNTETVKDISDKLKKAKVKFFSISDEKEKGDLLKYIERQQMELIKSELVAKEKYDVYSKIEDMIKKKTKPFFIWELEFDEVFENGGFDIVIGNPPYFRYQASHKGEIEELRNIEELQSAFGGKLNAYKLFLSKALHGLVKNDGVVNYIFQNSFMADKQASELRKDILSNFQLLKIDSYPERDSVKKRVFEAVKMSVCIVMIANSKEDKKFVVNVWDDKYKTSGTHTVFNKDDIYSVDPNYLSIPRLKQEDLPLIIKLKNANNLYSMKCYEGELNVTNHKPYFTIDITEPKVLRGASIQRYYWTEKMSQGEIEHIDEKKYLTDCSTSAKSRHHEYERIAMQGMTGANDKIRIVSTIVPAGVYLANSCNYILSEKLDLKFLLGVFNSKLINWYFRCFSTNSNVNGYEVDNIPITIPDKAIQQKIIQITTDILDLKQKDNSISTEDLESKIDDLVFEMYNLTQQEIKKINE